MKNSNNVTDMNEKLESFLVRACEAEEKHNYAEAERLFRLALYCEGRLRYDVTNAKEYVDQAGPVYQEACLRAPRLDKHTTLSVE